MAWLGCRTHECINIGTYMRRGCTVENVPPVPVWWGLRGFQTRKPVLSSLLWTRRLTVRASTSRNCERRDGWNEFRGSGGGGTGKCKERKYMVAEQRGSAPCSCAQSVCVKCSSQERRKRVVVGELRQEKRGQHRRSWQRTWRSLFRNTVVGATVGSGLWGLGGGEVGTEGGLELVDARSAVYAGCAGGTARGAVCWEGLGGLSSGGAGARGRAGAGLGGTATMARRPKP